MALPVTSHCHRVLPGCEVATGGGGGMSQFGGTEYPLPFVVTVASRPVPIPGEPTGWAVTFKNVDTTSHILGHIIYVHLRVAVTARDRDR